MSTESHTFDTAESTENDTVSELAARLDALEDALERHDERLSALETNDVTSPSTCDYRDASVLDVLEPGETVTAKRFQTLYRRYTDLVESGTIADRVRTLVNGPDFERCGDQAWAYRPRGEA